MRVKYKVPNDTWEKDLHKLADLAAKRTALLIFLSSLRIIAIFEPLFLRGLFPVAKPFYLSPLTVLHLNRYS